jgi:hypothetical protein
MAEPSLEMHLLIAFLAEDLLGASGTNYLRV